MCLAVPAKIIEIDGESAIADMMGARREVSLRLLPSARIGDYVLVHAGFGIQIIAPEDARESIGLFDEIDHVGRSALGTC